MLSQQLRKIAAAILDKTAMTVPLEQHGGQQPGRGQVIKNINPMDLQPMQDPYIYSGSRALGYQIWAEPCRLSGNKTCMVWYRFEDTDYLDRRGNPLPHTKLPWTPDHITHVTMDN